MKLLLFSDLHAHTTAARAIVERATDEGVAAASPARVATAGLGR